MAGIVLAAHDVLFSQHNAGEVFPALRGTQPARFRPDNCQSRNGLNGLPYEAASEREGIWVAAPRSADHSSCLLPRFQESDPFPLARLRKIPDSEVVLKWARLP